MPDYLSVDDQFLKKLREVAEANLSDESFGVIQLSEAMGMSRVTLYRKLKKTTGKSSSQFINELRLERARNMLLHKTGAVSEIAYQVGFASASYFNKCFHDLYGYTPGDLLRSSTPVDAGGQSDITLSKSDKTIAILPFKYDGPDEEKDYVAEGLREEIINKLHLLRGMQVISRTTTDTYRDSNKTIKDIALELKVNFILEGSYQSYQKNTRIRLQLIEAASDLHLWSHPYECDLSEKNLFEIQEELAFRITEDLKVHITREEEIRLKEMGTGNPAAYVHYQNGIGYAMLAKNEKYSHKWTAATEEFEKAVELDPDFGDAWLKLTEIIMYRQVWARRYFSGFLDLKAFNNNLEKARSMLDKANSLGAWDNELRFFIDSLYTRSLEDFLGAVEERTENEESTRNFNFFRIVGFLFYLKCDYYHAIKYWLKFKEMITGQDTPAVEDMHNLIAVTGLTGFTKEANELSLKTLAQTQNLLMFKYAMIPITTGTGNINEFCSLAFQLHDEFQDDPAFANFAMNAHTIKGNYKEAYLFLQKRIRNLKENGFPIEPNPYMAIVYKLQGMKDEMNWHCNRNLENRIALTGEGVVPNAALLNCYLAATFAMLGQRDELYASLDQIVQQKAVLMDVILQLKYSRHFEPYRKEKEYRKVLEALDNKFQLEKERIAMLFDRNGEI